MAAYNSPFAGLAFLELDNLIFLAMDYLLSNMPPFKVLGFCAVAPERP